MRLKKIILLLGVFLRVAKPVQAQMAVIDMNALAESIKENATLASILETGKQAYQTGKTALDYTQKITDTIGTAYSLALTAQSFINNSDQLMSCIIPDLTFGNMSFEITNVCTAQDFIREKLDMPTSSSVQNSVNSAMGITGGSYSWRNLSKKTKELWASIKKNRNEVLKKSVDDGLATALAVKADAKDILAASKEIISQSNQAKTVMEKVSVTNKGLADIHALLAQQTLLQASILQVLTAREKMAEPTVIGDAATTESEN